MSQPAADIPVETSDLPAATPALAAEPSFIEVDTAVAQHVPHVDAAAATPAAPTAAAAADVPASAAQESAAADDEDEPMSEIDDGEEDPAEHQAKMDAFLNALQHPEHQQQQADLAGSTSADDTEAFSETEGTGASSTTAAAASDPTHAAVAEVQEFINRQAAAAAKKAAESAGAKSPSAAAAERAARKAEFNAAVEALRAKNAARNEEEDEEEDEEDAEEDEEDEEAHARAAMEAAFGARNNNTTASAAAAEVDEEEEEDEEDEEEVSDSFFGWLKTRADNLVHGKVAHQVRSRSKWVMASALDYGGKALYVGLTVALIALPLAILELSEQTSIGRQDRLNKAPISDNLKMEIWTGMQAQTGPVDPMSLEITN